MATLVMRAIFVAALVALTSTAGALTVVGHFAPSARTPARYATVPLAPIPHPIRARKPISLKRAVDELAKRGFTEIANPQRKGRVAVLDAVAPHGEKLTLVIDLWNGDISGARLRFE